MSKHITLFMSICYILLHYTYATIMKRHMNEYFYAVFLALSIYYDGRGLTLVLQTHHNYFNQNCSTLHCVMVLNVKSSMITIA